MRPSGHAAVHEAFRPDTGPGKPGHRRENRTSHTCIDESGPYCAADEHIDQS
jgi:hypothetical protein